MADKIINILSKITNYPYSFFCLTKIDFDYIVLLKIK